MASCPHCGKEISYAAYFRPGGRVSCAHCRGLTVKKPSNEIRMAASGIGAGLISGITVFFYASYFFPLTLGAPGRLYFITASSALLTAYFVCLEIWKRIKL